MSDLTQKMPHDEDWKRELGYVFFSRRKLILTTAVAILIGAVLIALFWPATYAANTSLLLLGKRAQVSPVALDPVELRNPEVSIQDIISEVEIIRSPELARRVVRQLGENTGGAAASDKELLKEAHVFLNHLSADEVSDSSAIRLSYFAGSPEEAEQGLEALIDEYILYRAEVFNPVGNEQFFNDRVEHYKQRLDDLVERITKEGGEMSPDFMDQVIAGNLERLVQLQQQQSELELELATSTYIDNGPLKTKIGLLKDAIDQLRKETSEYQAERLAADSALREAMLISHSYDTFAKRAEEARINDSIARNRLAGDISVLNRAKGTAELVFPKKGTTIGLGIIVAVIVGLSVGLLAEFFDHTVRRPEDVQRSTGLPVLCSLPPMGGNGSHSAGA